MLSAPPPAALLQQQRPYGYSPPDLPILKSTGCQTRPRPATIQGHRRKQPPTAKTGEEKGGNTNTPAAIPRTTIVRRTPACRATSPGDSNTWPFKWAGEKKFRRQPRKLHRSSSAQFDQVVPLPYGALQKPPQGLRQLTNDQLTHFAPATHEVNRDDVDLMFRSCFYRDDLMVSVDGSRRHLQRTGIHGGLCDWQLVLLLNAFIPRSVFSILPTGSGNTAAYIF